ncbi:Carboxypeptidase regulatory-like domain-containing protein [Granulicella pectinivorans]|uniref:Carboxypeptidase regulatory-like domain-containing protein n=2 Tax=Granulicella pectinivorans TaxID=474950 RepID=A0A1I6L217_9BACT|nr:Carboxypeptidase regulatory-like domain-containing protein [Granulicella pectinivorans]
MRLLQLSKGVSLALLFSSLSLHAQMTTGRLIGTVTDASGAVLSHAEVSITNEGTGIVRTVYTSGDGQFTAVSLPPAEYDVKVSATGFSSSEVKHLVLTVGQELIHDFKLPVTGATQDVTIDAGAAIALDTSSAKIGANVSSREIENLPINGRQISQLYLLVPGATNAGTGTFDNIRFSGRAVEQNILRLDGIEATSIIDTSPGNLNGELTSTFRLQQSLEAVQEFRVDSSSYPAEMGTGTGGQISFITKSGTNKFHGSLFEYVRNDFFDAHNTFVTTRKPKFRLNQFGGSIGGPVMKDKMFFFANYEGLRQIYPTAFSTPTLTNFYRAQIPTTSPLYGLLAAFPTDPTPASAETATSTSSPVVVGNNKINEDFGSIRLDYHVNDRFSVFARYNRDQGVSTQVQDASLSKFGQVEVPQNGVIGVTQVWSPRVFNETKFGYNGAKMRVQGIAGPSPNADISKARISIAGLTNIGALISLSSSFNGVGAPYTAQSYSYIDNLSLVRGSHTLKFGVEVRPLSLYNNQIGGTTYTYNTPALFVANAPAQIQFFGDLSDLSPFTGLSGNALVKQAYYIGYAQDEWKVTSNLTLSYGMRYEYFSPLHETRNKNVFFDMTAGTIIPKYAGDWYTSKKTNFGPRVGLTWSPRWSENHTVLRLGAGMFYGPGQTEDQIQPEANDRVSRTFTTGKAYPILPATDVYQGYDINSPTLGYQPRAYAPGYSIPERVTTYTASVQQELPGKMQMMVAYVGSTGSNLFLRSITNLITSVTTNPTTGVGTAVRQFGGRFAEIDYKTSGGFDQYHSLQSSLQRRFARGLSLGAQYTWAKELGNSSGSNEATTAQNPYDFNTEYGRGTFDIRHSLNATVLYDLPFGRGRQFSLSGPLDAIAGGWQMGGIVNFRAGLPIDVLITRPDVAYVGKVGTAYAGQTFSSPVLVGGVVQTTAVANVPGGGNTRNIRRPNVVAGVSPYLKTGRQFLNPAAFSTPAPGTFGNSRRNDYTGPVLAQLDLTLAKSIHVAERMSFDFHADVYNIMNHPNYANPGTVRLTQTLATAPGNGSQPGTPFTLSNAGAFGALTSTVGNQVGIGANRQIQLSLRAIF